VKIPKWISALITLPLLLACAGSSQTATPPPPAPKAIVCIGDSQTFNTSLGLVLGDFYPFQLEVLINSNGGNVISRNLGVSGNTTSQMYSRVKDMFEYEIPTIAVVYGGTNDQLAQHQTVVASQYDASTKSFAVESGMGSNFSNGSKILINSNEETVVGIAADVITVLGSSGYTPTAGDPVVISTEGNLELIAKYLQGNGCSEIIFPNPPYFNWSSGGDTLSVQMPWSVPTRQEESDASSVEGAKYTDLYCAMRNRIINGIDIQGSFTWHVADQNVHMNRYGNQITAEAILQTIQDAGWMPALMKK